MDIRTRARITAERLIEDEADFYGTIDRYVEKLDTEREILSVKGSTFEDLDIVYGEKLFYHLAYSTLAGAVRAAARELGRYDEKTDTITR